MTCLVTNDGEKLPVFVVCLRRHCEPTGRWGAAMCMKMGRGGRSGASAWYYR